MKRKGNIEDVFDGKLYKKHFDDRGFFHGTSSECMQDELHISLQVNTDGVAIKTLVTLDGVKKRVVQAAVGEVERLYAFKRLVYCGTMIHSQDYKVVTRRNSYTVSFRGGVDSSDVSYGWVLTFLQCFVTCKNPVFCNSACLCKNPKFLVLIYELERAGDITLSADRHTNATASHIIPFRKDSGQVVAVKIENLISLCLTVLWCGHIFCLQVSKYF